MKKIYLIILVAIIIIFIGYFSYKTNFFRKDDTILPIVFTGTTSVYSNSGITNSGTTMITEDNIKISNLKSGDIIKSPFIVSGEARGSWFFEGSFPVELVDSNGHIIMQVPATASGEWMTEKFVPFTAKLIFNVTNTGSGELILRKDNPSGLSEKEEEIRIPVTIQAGQVAGQKVKLFYYNSSKDQDSTGNILCSTKGLVSIDREIPLTKTPIQDAINLLLQGQLTTVEKAMGITTEYPLSGLVLTGATLKNRVLTLSFVDPNNKTSGGSCRIGILRMQIEETAKQFNGVNEVKILPEDLFQP